MTQTAYAVILNNADGRMTIAPPAKTPECATRALSPFEGAQVFGLATIAVEPEPISGLQFRLRGERTALSATPAGGEAAGWAGRLNVLANAVLAGSATGSEDIFVAQVNNLIAAIRSMRDLAATQQPSAPTAAVTTAGGEAVAYPADSDRSVLLYLMQQFDAETWQCHQCGHAEDTASMDSANYLRKYLASAPPAAGAVPEWFQDVRRCLEDVATEFRARGRGDGRFVQLIHRMDAGFAAAQQEATP